MIKSKNIPVYKQIYLLYLTAKQEKALIDNNVERYFELTQKHFKSYFGLNLLDMVLYCPDLPETKAVMDRHACMVIKCLFDGYKFKGNTIYELIQEVFIKNLKELEARNE